MSKPASIDPADIEQCMLRLVHERGVEKSICPSDVARSLAGSSTEQWGPLMHPVRQVAVRLALEGRVSILRKGKPVDPNAFKGVYRIALTRLD